MGSHSRVIIQYYPYLFAQIVPALVIRGSFRLAAVFFYMPLPFFLSMFLLYRPQNASGLANEANFKS